MGEIAIRIENLTKVYNLYEKKSDRLKETLSISRKNYHKEFYAVKNFNLEIQKGETVGIIGKNGSGKSTLLKMLTGVLTPTKGSIQVNGKVAALLELGAGFNMEYTGIENIYLNGTMMGYSRDEMDERVKKIVEFADIDRFINQPVKTYSSGMFVRLAFAVAINVDPDILIVDEALSVGDLFFQLKCYKKFEDFKKQGKTILMVTHDASSVIKYCDYAVVMNEGEKIAQGPSNQMVDIYKKILAHQYGEGIADELPEEQFLEEETDAFQGTGGNIWKESMIVNPDFVEYGNKKAEIIDFGIFDDSNHLKQTIMKNRDFTIRMKVLFHEDIDEPIFAFTIKDIKGNELSGTNTMLESVETGSIRRGKVVTVSFKQKNLFQRGFVFLSLGCTKYDSSGELEIYHRLYDICRIDTVATKDSVGFFDLNSKVLIS